MVNVLKYFAYVIRSEVDGSYYKGHTQDLRQRVAEHNAGRTRSINGRGPWHIVYYEELATRNEAITRERYFKSAAGRIFLRLKLEDAGSPPD